MLPTALEIEDFLERKPRALSGGQRQRVAMGRAIVREPHAFLMDEPLSNLDAKLRVQMRAEIHQLQRRLGVTTIYVTHDQVEAMTMGDRVAVMRGGRLQQVDTPQVLYDQPVNEFVAGFIGSPSINLVEAVLEQQNGGFAVTFGDHRLAVDDTATRNRSGLADYVGRTLILGIRPEDLEDASLQPDAPADRRIKTVAILTEPLGAEVLVHFVTSATESSRAQSKSRPPTPKCTSAAAATRTRRLVWSPASARGRASSSGSRSSSRSTPAASTSSTPTRARASDRPGGRGALQDGQPLTDPAVRPARIRRCKTE